MRGVLILALIAAVALAQSTRPPRWLSDEQRAKFEEIRQAKLDKLSPEAQAAGKKIREIFQAKKDDKKAAHKEAIAISYLQICKNSQVHEFFEILPESVRTELKSLRKPQLTDEQRKKIEEIRQAKMEKLTPEAQAAAKKIREIFDSKKDDKKAAHEEPKLSDKQRKKIEEIVKAKLEKLSPQAQAAGKKIREFFESKKDDNKAAQEAVHSFIESLPESVRAELKTLRAGRKPLTEEQKEEFKARLQEKIDKLSDEGKAAAKQIREIIKANKNDTKAIKDAIEKVLEDLSESVREELKALRPKNRGQRTTTPKTE